MRRLLFCLFLVIATAATTAAAASDTLYPSQLLKNKPQLAQQYQTMIKPVQSDHGWVADLGTQTPVSQITLEKKHYAVLSGCKPHDCSSQSVVSLMSPGAARAVGALVVNTGDAGLGAKSSRIIWLGGPDNAQRRFIAAYLFR